MKSNPAAVDVAARWAEASEKRSKMPLLTDVLQFKEDKSSEECPPPKTVPNKRGSEAQSSAGPAAEKRAKDPRSHTPSPAEKEAKVPEKELSAENEGVQAERPQTGESAVSQNAPGAGTKKRKPDDFPQATLKEMPAATWTSRPKHTAPSKEAPPQPASKKGSEAPTAAAEAALLETALPEQAAGRVNPSKNGKFTAEEEKSWNEFKARMGADWQKRFASQALKRLQRAGKKEKKEKKDKKEKKNTSTRIRRTTKNRKIRSLTKKKRNPSKMSKVTTQPLPMPLQRERGGP